MKTQPEPKPASAHTPGPWLTFGDTITAADKLAPGYTLQICAVGSLNDNVRHERTELEANKKLIAAAPDLLAACEFVLSHLYDPEKPDVQQKLYSDCLAPTDDDKTVRTWLREIIAKAGGLA